MDGLARIRDSLIFVTDARAAGGDQRELQRACRRGLLVRVRRGVYVRRDAWDGWDPVQRHLAHVLVVAREAEPPFLVAGRSAGAVWDLPFSAEWPEPVTLLIRHDRGGKSEPGVRRTVASAAGATGTTIDGLPVTTLERTALDVARTLAFPRAVAVVDDARSSRRDSAASWLDLREALDAAAYVRLGHHVRRVVEFSSERSGSPYESMARAVIHELGFEQPELQVRFEDAQGEMFPDFYWPSVNVAAEFDGEIKYTRDEYTSGDPSRVVFLEKQREDRLRVFVRRIVRLLARHVHNPPELAALLDHAGVPRRRPGYASSAPVVSGAVAPVLEQWPNMVPR